MKRKVVRTLMVVVALALMITVGVHAYETRETAKEEPLSIVEEFGDALTAGDETDGEDTSNSSKADDAKAEDESTTKSEESTTADHEHVWVTKEATGHWEDDVNYVKVYVCDGCDFYCGGQAIMEDHQHDNPDHGGYHQETIKEPAETSHWVVDTEAGEYCEICGVKRSDVEGTGNSGTSDNTEAASQVDETTAASASDDE